MGNIFDLKHYPVSLIGVLTLMVYGLTLADKPSAPLSSDAPATEFSAERAFTDLSDLLKENVPHPAGSTANKVIRDRITKKLQARDFGVSLQRDFACQPRWRTCSNVENIIATKAGTEGGSTIMLMSHYDSVPAGAAATDDGYGVAVTLEIARALQHLDPIKNNLIFLITDAEEIGLLGAEAFALNHPLMEEVDILINIESRGTSGNSVMFETGADNNALIDIYKRAVDRPVANSVTYEIYKRMPNNTDYTVFKNRDVPGLNFASTGSASRYHSVLDDLDHLDKATLQQHGNNALGMLLELANMDLSNLPDRQGEATYVDVYSSFLLKWSSSFNAPLSILALLVLVSFFAINLKAKSVTVKSMTWALLSLLITGALVAGSAALLAFPLGIWQDLHPLDHPAPWPGKAALLLAALLMVITTSYFLRKLNNFRSLLFVSWFLTAILVVALSFTISGATYIGLAPLMAFNIGLILDYIRAGRKVRDIDFAVSAHLGFFAAAYIGLYHFHLLDLILNFNMSAAKISVLLLAAFCILPLAHHNYEQAPKAFKFHVLALTAVILVTSVVSMRTPGFTEHKPDPLNVLHVENWDSKEAFLTLEHLLTRGDDVSAYFNKMGFTGEPEEYPLSSWGGRMRPRKTASYQALQPPTFDIVSDGMVNGSRVIEADVSTGRRGFAVELMFSKEAPIEAIEVNGHSALEAQINPERSTRLALGGIQNDTVRVKVTLSDMTSFQVTIEEAAPLLNTASMQELLALRPPTAQSTQDGDRSVVYRTVQF